MRIVYERVQVLKPAGLRGLRTLNETGANLADRKVHGCYGKARHLLGQRLICGSSTARQWMLWVPPAGLPTANADLPPPQFPLHRSPPQVQERLQLRHPSSLPVHHRAISCGSRKSKFRETCPDQGESTVRVEPNLFCHK